MMRNVLHRGVLLALAAWGVMPMVVAADLSVRKTVQQAPKKVTSLSASRLELHTKASQMASGIAAAEAALTPAELDVAALVQTGRFPCDAGVTIELQADASAPGMFDLRLLGQRFRLAPVPTSTGAVRLEDAKTGAVWLQLANKSMLMNQKLGRRMADECHSPGQQVIADAMLRAPPASILDAAPSLTEPMAEAVAKQ